MALSVFSMQINRRMSFFSERMSIPCCCFPAAEVSALPSLRSPLSALRQQRPALAAPPAASSGPLEPPPRSARSLPGSARRPPLRSERLSRCVSRPGLFFPRQTLASHNLPRDPPPAHTPCPPTPQSTGFGFGASQPAAGGFGAPAASPFGAAAAPSAFGAAAAPTSGSRGLQFQPVQDQEPGAQGQGPQAIKFMSMSAMPQFKVPEKSHEEIRYEDYAQGVKGNTVRGGRRSPAPEPAAPAARERGSGAGADAARARNSLRPQGTVAPAATPFGAGSTVFGAQPSTPSPFGGASNPFAPTTSASPFGGAASAPAFGSAAPAFGAATSPSNPFGGAAAQPAFGAASNPFGAASQAAPSPFGAAPAANPFGAPAASTPFGAAPAGGSVFGSTSPAFGAAASAPAFGAGAFGSSTPAFGAATSTPFGAQQPSQSLGRSFRTSLRRHSKPRFSPLSHRNRAGAAPTSTPFGGGASAFGASSAAPAFGAASTPAFGFGASSPSAGGGLFGASAPATGFGATAFGACAPPVFCFAVASSRRRHSQ